ncbi:MAG: YIP1 family protein [Lachnospirales bacterium]
MSTNELIENLKNLIIAPKKLYESIKVNPSFIVPLILLLIITAASTILGSKSPTLKPEIMAAQLTEATGRPEAGDMILKQFEMAEEMGISANAISIPVVLMSAGGTIVTLVIFAALLLLITKILSGEATFKKMFTLLIYNNIVASILTFFAILLMVLLNSSINIFSFAAVIMPKGNMYDPVFVLLNAITIPAIYSTVLNIIGVKVICEYETYTKSIFINIVGFILPIIFAISNAIIALNAYKMIP